MEIGSDPALDSVVARMAVSDVHFDRWSIDPGGSANVDAAETPALYGAIEGHGRLWVQDQPSAPLRPDTLVLIPRGRAFRLEADGDRTERDTGAPDAPRRPADHADPGLTVVGGPLNVTFAGGADLFAHLEAPVFVTFDGADGVGTKFRAAMDELAAGRPAGGAMASALLTQVIIILLRRCLAALDPWAEHLAQNHPHFARRTD
jgi:AraC family transcriptional activator of mtrCDE